MRKLRRGSDVGRYGLSWRRSRVWGHAWALTRAAGSWSRFFGRVSGPRSQDSVALPDKRQGIGAIAGRTHLTVTLLGAIRRYSLRHNEAGPGGTENWKAYARIYDLMVEYFASGLNRHPRNKCSRLPARGSRPMSPTGRSSSQALHSRPIPLPLLPGSCRRCWRAFYSGLAAPHCIR